MIAKNLKGRVGDIPDDYDVLEVLIKVRNHKYNESLLIEYKNEQFQSNKSDPDKG